MSRRKGLGGLLNAIAKDIERAGREAGRERKRKEKQYQRQQKQYQLQLKREEKEQEKMLQIQEKEKFNNDVLICFSEENKKELQNIKFEILDFFNKWNEKL